MRKDVKNEKQKENFNFRCFQFLDLEPQCFWAEFKIKKFTGQKNKNAKAKQANHLCFDR